MAATIKIDGFDLYPYLRVTPGDGFDPTDTDFRDPQFGDSSTSVGDPLLSLREHNREIVIPVHLSPKFSSGAFASTKDGLHLLVTDVNKRLASAQQLEWADDGATASTFFDVEFARFEPEYNYRRAQILVMSGVLRLWVKPYGHTGTMLLAGTIAGTGACLLAPISRSIKGDVPAYVRLQASGFNQVPDGGGRVLAFAPINHPSYGVVIPAGSIVPAPSAFNVATTRVLGDSTAAGSQYFHPLGQSNPYGYEFSIYLSPGTAYAGDNRVFAMMRSRDPAGVGVRAFDALGNALGPTAVASTLDWSLIDLGVLRVPTYQPPATVSIAVRTKSVPPLDPSCRGLGGAQNFPQMGGASSFRWGPHFGQAYILPDSGLQLTNDDNRQLIGFDSFTLSGTQVVMNGQVDNFGNRWTTASTASRAYLSPSMAAPVAQYLYTNTFTTLDVYLSGTSNTPLHGGLDLETPLVDNLYLRTTCAIDMSAAFSAAGSYCYRLDKRVDELNTNSWYEARVFGELGRVNASRLYLAIGEESSAGRVLLASTALTPALAEGNTPVSQWQMEFGNQGRQLYVAALANQSTATAHYASLGAYSDSLAELPGKPAVRALVASSGIFTLPYIGDITVMSRPSQAVGGQDSYVFDSYGQVARITSSSVDRDVLPRIIGNDVMITPSTVAVAGLVAPLDAGNANQRWSFDVRALERFTYFR